MAAVHSQGCCQALQALLPHWLSCAQQADHATVQSPLRPAAGLHLTFSRNLARTMLESQTVLPRLLLFGFWAKRRVMLQHHGSCETM